MATFSTKFIKGEQVYYIDEFYHDRTCSYCSGTGEITLVRNNKVKTVRCPVCKGFGLENKSKWKVSNLGDSIPVTETLIHSSSWGTDISYVLGYGDYLYDNTEPVWIDEKNCFSTLEEAQEECNKRNGEE